MIDAAPPPKLWTPPKSAIIRARGDELYRLAPEGKRAVFPFPAYCPLEDKFAVDADRVVTGSQTSATPSYSLPSGIVSGDLILVLVTGNNMGTDTVTAPVGFTPLYEVTYGAHKACAYYKFATGGESSASITISASRVTACGAYRITGATHTPEMASATGSNKFPDPPSLSPSFGSRKTLWLAVTHHSERTVQSYPSGYSNGTQFNSGSSQPIVGACSLQYEGATQDPGQYQISNTTSWAAVTVAV